MAGYCDSNCSLWLSAQAKHCTLPESSQSSLLAEWGCRNEEHCLPLFTILSSFAIHTFTQSYLGMPQVIIGSMLWMALATLCRDLWLQLCFRSTKRLPSSSPQILHHRNQLHKAWSFHLEFTAALKSNEPTCRISSPLHLSWKVLLVATN